MAIKFTPIDRPEKAPVPIGDGPTSPDLTMSEAAVLEHLECDMSLSAMGKAERLEIARAILRALNTLKVKQYRDRKKSKGRR